MRKILINFAHPATRRSKINKALRNAVQNLENVTINDLYENYPDFMIDVKREQKLCQDHDVIVFQYPLYWYSTPAILKEWQDLVLEHGWAYGLDAHGLEGKYFLQVLSAGGDESTYHKDGFNEFSMDELSAPLKAMAKLCKMKWLPPFAVFGVHRGLAKDKIEKHSEDYRRIIIALRDEKFDIDKAQKNDCCNQKIDTLIKRSE